MVTYKRFDKHGYEIRGYDHMIDRMLRFFSIPIAKVISKLGVRPEVIAIISLVIFIFSSLLYAIGDRISIILASILFFIAWILDCVDGDLARLTSQVSDIGEWLDSTVGKLATVLVYFGICIGLSRRSYGDWVWVGGFLLISGFYFSGAVKNKVNLIKSKKKPVQHTRSNASFMRMNFLRSTIREFLTGHNILYITLICGSLLNKLHIVLMLSAMYIWFFSALTILNSYKTLRQL